MDSQEKTTEILKYADPIRVFAILAVISLHAAAVRVVHLPEVNTVGWWTANSIDSLCRWAVPVFIMLSGTLNLNVQKQYSLAEFFTKKFSKVGIPLVLWAGIYFYWSAKYYQMDVSLDFIKTALWAGLTYNHLYFLYIIIGLYMVTPLIKFILKLLPLYFVYGFVGILLYIAAVGVFFDRLPQVGLTMFLPYIMYYLLGLLLNGKMKSMKLLPVYIMCYGIVSLVIIIKTFMLVDEFGQNDYRSFLMYDHFNIFVIIQSVCIFQLFQCQFSHERDGFLDSMFKYLATVSFGVYLIHIIFLDKFREFTSGWSEEYLLFVMLLEVVVVYAMSVIVSSLVKRIPFLRTTIGL